jgi:hypothetical protein
MKPGAIPIVVAVLFAWAGLAVPVRAAPPQDVWVALVRADEQPPSGDPRLNDMTPRLREVFGYPSYHVVQDDVISLGATNETWVVPRNDFYLKLIPVESEPRSARKLYFEIYRGRDLLIQGKAKLYPGRPLFISGPDDGNGKLIFILHRKDS